MSNKFTKEDLDTQFDAFLRDSVSSEESLQKYLKKPVKKERKSKWYEEDNENDNSTTIGTGLSPSGKSFLKTKESKSGNSQDESKAAELIPKQKNKKDVSNKNRRGSKQEVSLSKDSLEDISEKSEDISEERKKIHQLVAQASYENNKDSFEGEDDILNEYVSTGPGVDTLNELADKQQFFQGLEEEADQSVDYHRLIGEISGTTYNPADTNHKIADMLDDSREQEERRNELYHHEVKEHSYEKDSSHQKPSMLSKVSLLDSMDSTMNTTTSPKVGTSSRDHDVSQDNLKLTVPGTIKTHTGTEFMGTNTSKEIEDLHQAMREVNRSGATTDQHDQPFDMSASRDQLVNDLFNTNTNGKERPISEIFHDIDQIESKRAQRSDVSTDFKLLSDYKTQPNIQAQHKKGSQSSGIDDSKMDGGGFDHSHTEDTEVFHPPPVTAVSVREKKKKEKLHNTISSQTVDHGRSKSRSKYGNIQSSGYGRKSPSVSPIRSPSKSPIRPLSVRTKKLSQSSPDVSRQKNSKKASSKSQYVKQGDKKIQDQKQLLASVDSFTRYIKDQINGKDLPGAKWSQDEPSQSSSIKLDKSGGLNREQVLLQELKDLQQQWQEVRKENVTLKGDMTSMRQEHAQEIENFRLEHEKELFKLKQENFVLAAKNQVDDEQKEQQRKQITEDLDNVAKERINKLEKEIKEQETLIVGYQQENQRLYNEVKQIDKNTKDTEGSMFKENQKLVREVSQLRELLSQKEYELKHKGIITSVVAQQEIAGGQTSTSGTSNQAVLGAGKIAQLESELKETTKQYDMLQRELKTIQNTKIELEQHIDTLIREREDIKKQLDLAKTLRPEDARALEEKYQQEIEKLSRKLKWYVENQEMLDKGAKTMKTKDLTIEKLKKQVEDLQTETGKKLEENKLRAKERAADARRIQDLERQVREMDQIIRKRHPNSLPAMILAAGAVPDSIPDKKTPTNLVLENRIKKLESELASKDSENEQLLRGMEQKYNAVKMQFEERIYDLESQLSRFIENPGDPHPHTHVGALQKELDSTRDRYKKQIAELQSQILQLQTELQKSQKTNGLNTYKLDNSSESELRLQVLQLQREVENKSHDIQVLQKSLEKLRKEKHLYMSNGVGKYNTDVKKGKSKKSVKRLEENGINVTDNILYQSSSDHYNSHVNITDIVKENEYLKNKVERLQLSLDQQRVDLRKSLAETEAVVRRSREEYEDKIDTIRSSHQKEFQRILSEQAISHSTSKVAELHSKCDAQEVLIQHLKEQLSKNEVDAERISILKIENTALQTQIEKLQDQLADAKRNYTPGMKHFVSIQEKITQMERRHEKREEELQDIIKNTQIIASTELDKEAEKWKKIVEMKNLEIEKFRTELDSILNVIRMLQKQGVVLPLKS
ncbi:hypothetical protein SNE40_018734 [Patella caerulea]|uniref:Centrosomal protein of 162 kDa n=1 Tax=Patella caerulea TaxID=87958 RepID=A0AAN8J6I8_PATCE